MRCSTREPPARFTAGVKAVVHDRYGPPEDMRTVDVPPPRPGNGQVLVRVRATSLNLSDWEALVGRPAYARIGRRPILGSDIAGVVEAVGPGVTGFGPGDEVFGDNLEHKGGFAEYAVARATAMASKPAGLSFEDAAALPQSGVIALQGTRRVRPGQRMLVNGAAGGAGSFAVQLAKRAGAEVTGVDRGDKLDFVRSMGADHVVDYTRTEFTRTGERYDHILDLVASRGPWACRRALAPGGRYRAVGGPVRTLLGLVFLGPLTGRRIGVLAVRPNTTDLLEVAELYRTGALRPVVERTFPLAEVPAALRHLGDGHARGKLVVTVD
jgi:NADPH:quinone reductase-like Zn-dependent oxidoreductase